MRLAVYRLRMPIRHVPIYLLQDKKWRFTLTLAIFEMKYCKVAYLAEDENSDTSKVLLCLEIW